MAYLLKGIRSRTLQLLRPMYQALPIDDQGVAVDEMKQETGYGYSQGSLGQVGIVATVGKGLHFLIVLPLLLARSLYMCWLLLTSPVRRLAGRIWAFWPGFYANLGLFRHLVPSFMNPENQGPARKLHPSAWLDGLRGIAAFFVVWHHASLMWFSWRIHSGYGNSDKDHMFVQLPFVRLLVSGPPQVAIFFVVSGYALSYKPLKLSRMGRFNEANDAIGSAVFRRFPRLFIMPVVVATGAMLLTYWGCFGTEGWKGTAIPSRQPPRHETFAAQLADFWPYILRITNLISRDLDRGRFFLYDQNLWTLPIEFDCSLLIFLCHAAFNRLRPRIRMSLIFGLMVYAHNFFFWREYMFLAGVFLCDLHFALDGTGGGGDSQAQSSDSSKSRPSFLSATSPFVAVWVFFRQPRVRAALWLSLFVLAVFVLCIPDDSHGGPKSPGYMTLYSWVSERYRRHKASDKFWLPLASTLLVFSVDRAPFLQRLFTTSFAQYLGTISYSMYLVHGTILWTVGHWIVITCTTLTGIDTDIHYLAGIALTAACVWPIIICCADVVTRLVDEPAVRFGRWLYDSWCYREEPVLPRTS